MKVNTQLMLMLSKLMPEEMLIEELEKNISEYKQAKLVGNDEEIQKSRQGIAMYSMMIATSIATEKQSVDQTMEMVEKSDRLHKMYDEGTKVN